MLLTPLLISKGWAFHRGLAFAEAAARVGPAQREPGASAGLGFRVFRVLGLGFRAFRV